jgi:hypothetical protein
MESEIINKKRQQVKEEAVLLALQNGMALIRRDLEIYGMKKDGFTEFISKSVDYDTLWEDALRVLKEKILKK